MTKNRKLVLLIIITLSILVLISTIFFQVYFIATDTYIIWIGWIEDILVTINAFLYRYAYIRVDEVSRSFQESDIIVELNEFSKSPLKPHRFLNIMPYAMLIGTTASIVINIPGSDIWFLIGMGVYFIMQIMLIIAYSGIIHLKLQVIFSNYLRWWTIAIIGGWLVYISVIFPLFILPGLEGMMLIFVLIYVLSLIVMCIIAYLQLPYRKRTLGIRFALALGVTSFVFSDTLIGITYIGGFYQNLSILIHPTWTLAIVLISTAVLFQTSTRISN